MKYNKSTFFRLGIAFFFVFASSCLVVYYVFFISNVLKKSTLYIKSGSTHNEAINQVTAASALKNISTFKIAITLVGSNKYLYRGLYFLEPGMTNFQIIKILNGRLQTPVTFTISAATNKMDLIQQACNKLDLNREKLNQLLNDDAFLKEFGFNSENVLAMFIPNTYQVYWTISEKDFCKRMYKEYKIFWNDLRLQKAKKLQLSPIQISILASIVQMETNNSSEACKVSGVYINRLRKKKPLCSCPSIQYLLGDKSIRRILKKDLQIDSPYNTYRRLGLPPGPICMPSIVMIDAVLDSVAHDYFYFSVKDDFSGALVFAKNFKEHIFHANKYRKALTKRGILR